jgi:hypothetical protein
MIFSVRPSLDDLIEFPAFSQGLRSSNSFPMRLPMMLIAKVINTAELS